MNQELNNLVCKKVDQLIQSSEVVIDMETANLVREFFSLYMNQIDLMRDIYRAFKKQLPSIELYHRLESITYTSEEKMHVIQFSTKRLELPEILFSPLFISVIEIMKDILPLGTVVELDPTYFKPDQNLDAPTKVVITERFVAPTGYHSYFPYGGIVYPIGEIQKGAKIHFTDPLIKRVIHRGYEDETEAAFIYLIKEEFIVDKGMHSIEFSTEDMRKVEEDVKQKEDVL